MFSTRFLPSAASAEGLLPGSVESRLAGIWTPETGNGH